MIKNPLLILSALFVAFSCESHAEHIDKVEAPVLVSVSPENGASGIAADGSTDIVFTYNQNIKASPAFGGCITISPDAEIQKANAYGKTLTITVGGLKHETTYTLSIAPGYVKGFRENQDAAEGASTSFTTVNAPAPPKEIPEPGIGSGGWENNTAAVLNMKYGWNLGNTLDA